MRDRKHNAQDLLEQDTGRGICAQELGSDLMH
jgi:hypothetical protein